MEPRRAYSVKAAPVGALAQLRILGMTFGQIGAESAAELDPGERPGPPEGPV